MNIFNESMLAAAKDAGIPIAVVVGVLAIFAALVALRANREIYRTVAVAGLVAVACLMFIFYVSTREIYQWIDTKSYADWAGNDEGWTDGELPSAEYCNRTREGAIVTCWRNRPTGYPTTPAPRFAGKGNAAWCTYKLQEQTTFGKADGNARGRVYICGRVSL